MPPEESKTPNLTTIFIAIVILAIIAIAGGVILHLFDKDVTVFYGFITPTLATVVGFAAVARQQGKMNENVSRVESKVNGNLSKLIDLATQNATSRSEVAEARKIGVESGVIPVTYADADLGEVRERINE